MDPSTSAGAIANLSISEQSGSSNTKQGEQGKKDKGKAKQHYGNASGQKPSQSKPNSSKSTKLRGLEKDSPEVRVSKTLSWILRHGAQSEGIEMRRDGYVKLADLVSISLSLSTCWWIYSSVLATKSEVEVTRP